jgi:hypothetical protein
VAIFKAGGVRFPGPNITMALQTTETGQPFLQGSLDDIIRLGAQSAEFRQDLDLFYPIPKIPYTEIASSGSLENIAEHGVGKGGP